MDPSNKEKQNIMFYVSIFRNVMGLQRDVVIQEGEIFPYNSEHFPHAENLELFFYKIITFYKTIRGNIICILSACG